jgi:hypothetical protein
MGPAPLMNNGEKLEIKKTKLKKYIGRTDLFLTSLVIEITKCKNIGGIKITPR